MEFFVVVFILLLVAINCASATQTHEWSLYKAKYSKKYHNQYEDRHRMEIFLKNKDEIVKHNRMYDKGQVSYNLNVNEYSDLTPTEFNSQLKGLQHSFGNKQNSTMENYGYFIGLANTVLPKSVDWRQKGAVTRVKEQRHCGACWAFSVTGALEGQYFLKSGRLVSLSEQNLVDCSIDKHEVKCDGNSRHDAFKYIKKNGGIDTEKSYPYKGVGGSCKYSKSKRSGVTVQSFKDIPEGDEQKLQQAIATVGPISVCVDASHDSFQFYSSGIYYEPKCKSDTDHAVLAVGYGTDSRGREYYIIKNSWGTKWGENGYMRIARNRKNHCGIASEATYPIV